MQILTLWGDGQIEGLPLLAPLPRGTDLNADPIKSGEASVRAVEDTKARHLPTCTLRRILGQPRYPMANDDGAAAGCLLDPDVSHRKTRALPSRVVDDEQSDLLTVGYLDDALTRRGRLGLPCTGKGKAPHEQRRSYEATHRLLPSIAGSHH